VTKPKRTTAKQPTRSSAKQGPHREAAAAVARPRLAVPDWSWAEVLADPIVRVDVAGTVVLLVALSFGVGAGGAAAGAAAVVSLGLFVLGLAAFVAAYLAGIQRSRTHVLGIGGWFFLAGSAPRRVTIAMNALLAVQVVGTVTAASLRPFTEIAFAILTWVYGLALSGLWGARSGVFPDRPTDRPLVRRKQ
jgi:hypothetical protein